MRAASGSLAALLAGVLLLAGRPAAAGHVTLPAGARLHLEPDATSPALTMLDEETLVEVIERKGEWVLVRYEPWRGWAREAAPASLLDERGGPDVPRDWITRDLLARGRSLLRNGGREVRFEGRTLLTDVADDELLTRLAKGVRLATGVLRERWRIAGPVPPGSVVFLFDSAAAERELSPAACGVVDWRGARIVALSRHGGEALLDRLLHQVGHLHARELLGTGLPAWVEEGFADVFAEAGTSATHSKWSQRPLPAAPRSAAPPPTLAELFASGPELFDRSPEAEAFRAETISFVRYLADPRPKRFPQFRTFLHRGLRGRPLDAPALERVLREDLATIERRYRAYRAGGE